MADPFISQMGSLASVSTSAWSWSTQEWRALDAVASCFYREDEQVDASSGEVTVASPHGTRRLVKPRFEGKSSNEKPESFVTLTSPTLLPGHQELLAKLGDMSTEIARCVGDWMQAAHADYRQCLQERRFGRSRPEESSKC